LPGASDEALGRFWLWPGALSDLPGISDEVAGGLICPGAVPDEPGDCVWARAGTARAKATAAAVESRVVRTNCSPLNHFKLQGFNGA
jgi:hypothetical protein